MKRGVNRVSSKGLLRLVKSIEVGSIVKDKEKPEVPPLCPYCKCITQNVSAKQKIPQKCDLCKRFYIIATKYGLSVNAYKQILEEQENRCAICNDLMAKDTNIDHCHALDHVRGILCTRCNQGLGMFKDNPYRLKSAIRYLQENETQRKWWFQKENPNGD